MLDTKYLLEFEKPIASLYKKVDELKNLVKSGDINPVSEINALEDRIEFLRREIFSHLTPNQIVAVARHILRPTTLDYVKLIFDDFIELHGDRYFGEDKALVGGFAKLNGIYAMVMGHQKGKTTKENIIRNFGMAHPEGYRKSLRLMRLAEKFGRPIITFVDTPGAYPGIDAEERGQAEAIGQNLKNMFDIKVPIITVITGEGGSGGALGIAVANRVLMLEYSIYSVISPEGCAAILFRDAGRSSDAAENLKLTAKDLLKLEVIDGLINEPLGGAHNNYEGTAGNIKINLEKYLSELTKLSSDEILKDRYSKFRRMGFFNEDLI